MIKFYLKNANIEGLKKAEQFFVQEITGALEGIGKRLRTSMRGQMRDDSGAAKRSLQIEITGRGLSKSLFVYSDLLQAFVDAEGIRPGKAFPDTRPGSRLYRWAERKQRGLESRTVKTKAFTKRGRGRPKKETGVFRVKDYRQKTRLTKTARQKRRDASVRRFAYLVARKIYRQGIEPTYWNTEALAANSQRIQRDLENAVIRAVRRINGA